jgi:hypothetical protein
MTRHNDRHRLRDLRDDRRHAAAPKPAKKGLVAKVIGLLAVVAVAGLFVGRPGCRADVQQANTLPPKKPLAKLRAAELQQQTAEYGIAGGVAEGMKVSNAAKKADAIALMDDPSEPEVKATDSGFVVLKVRSDRFRVLKDEKSREEAIKEAVAKARQTLIDQGKVPPGEWPLTYDKEKVRNVWPSDGTRQELEDLHGVGCGRVEIDEVTLTHDTLRQERAKANTAQTGFWFGTAFLGLLAVYGFLRLDMWTKGYLTLILGIVVGGVVVAAIAGLGMAVLK